VTEVVSDANVLIAALANDEVAHEECRVLLDAFSAGLVDIVALDLTPYEIGNAIMRGQRRSADHAIIALESLITAVPNVTPDVDDLREAARLAEVHNLTFYDAAYAAVAMRRGAYLATLDQRLVASGLGQRPSAIVRELGLGQGRASPSDRDA
jgi:predicted nucleic acid-binding protein